jgi:hypothetical protein
LGGLPQAQSHLRRFFGIITPQDLRRSILALAAFTGWQPSEIGDLDFDEFSDYLDELPKEK